MSSYRIVSGSNMGIKVWDTREGDCIMNLNKHTDWLSSLEKLPNENLVSSSHDNTVRVWDLSMGLTVKKFKDVSDVGLNCLRLLKNGNMACGSLHKKITILNLDTGKNLQVLKAHTAEVWDLQIPANNKTNEMISCSEDKRIKFWNLETGECFKTLIVSFM
jgi:WD40 repeat protein